MTDRRRRVVWAEAARRDVHGIVEYLLGVSMEAARRVLERIEGSAARLQSAPLRGRVVPELAQLHIRAYRELQVPPYRLIYRPSDDRVLVVAVFDGRRNLEDVLLERLIRLSEEEEP